LPRVREIEIRGNRNIPTEQILAAVTNTKISEPAEEEKLRVDLRAILDLGWFADAQVRLENVEDGVRVVFFVTENPVVAEIIIEGNTALPADEIQRALGVPIGEVLNLTRMREGARAVQKLYEDRGFVLARVQDIGLVPTEGQEDRGRLRVRIVEGTIEAVRFEGLRRTRDQTVRRHLRIRPGTVFNINDLNRDLQRLFDLGLFESIRARPEPGTSPDNAIVVIEVTEARTAQITGGVGYSTRDGLLGFIEFRDRNWRGLGQTFSVRTDRSVQLLTSPRFNYEVTFTDPFFDGQRTSLDLSLFARTSEEKEYNSAGTAISRFDFRRNGGFVALTRPLDNITIGGIRLKSERTDIAVLPLDTGVSSCGVPPDPAICPPPSSSLLTPGRVVSLQVNGSRDTRDDRLRPVRGDRAQASAEFGVRLLGSDFGFGKYTIEYQRYFPLGANSTILTRVLAGFSTGTLPAQDQFVLGGSSTVRSLPGGFSRGKSLYVANVEYQFPLGNILPRLGDTRGIVFVDAGAIPAVTGTKIGYGIGIALQTPLGPIRIDLAFGAHGTQTWLSLGTPFN
jgi:outer membrane protein insertion porin family